MIERKFINQNIKEFQIQEYIKGHLPRVGHSYTKLVRTPLGEKIVICASRPGLVVGKDGGTITKLTRDLKEKFNLENPQIELVEVENPHLDANIVAEMIANSLEQFGTSRFKGIAHKALTNVMNAGALGIEIHIGGKVPSARAKSWRFTKGYIKKCGDAALMGVQHAYARAQLKTGTVGVQVRIMPPTIKLPDDITMIDLESQPAPSKGENLAPVKKSTENIAPPLATPITQSKTSEPATVTTSSAQADEEKKSKKTTIRKPRVKKTPKVNKDEQPPTATE